MRLSTPQVLAALNGQCEDPPYGIATHPVEMERDLQQDLYRDRENHLNNLFETIGTSCHVLPLAFAGPL
jgi:hypothetical protein